MNQPASDKNRLDYLEALGIDLWQRRVQVDDTDDSVVSLDAESSAPAALVGSAESSASWDSLRAAVAGCTACSLHQSRTQTVFGVGNTSADWMIVGEAPGAEEDRRGEPFVGRAGKLLDEVLRAVDLDRSTVFIANILKCRPPNNRDPSVEEAAACRGYLDRQIELVKPKLILAVGRIAAQQLLATDLPVGRMRGEVHRLGDGAIPVVVTYHPAYLLRSPSQKRKVWDDLCLARKTLQQ